MTHCPKCSEMLMPWYKFCPKCGEKIPEDKPVGVEIKCPRCGGTGKIKVESLFDI